MPNPSDEKVHLVTNRAHAKMINHAAAEVFVRDFPAVISDEPPSREGIIRGLPPLNIY